MEFIKKSSKHIYWSITYKMIIHYLKKNLSADEIASKIGCSKSFIDNAIYDISMVLIPVDYEL